MSVLTDKIYNGAESLLDSAENAVKQIAQMHGDSVAVGFPTTAYGLPLAYIATGGKINSISEAKSAIASARSLSKRTENLEQALKACIGAAIAAEILECTRYFENGGMESRGTSFGFVADSAVRNLCVPISSRDIPAIAAITGKAPSDNEAVELARHYQSNGILCFLSGSFLEQVQRGGLKLGIESRLVPLGAQQSAISHFFSFIARIALMFGRIKPGDLDDFLKYTKENIISFVDILGGLSDEDMAIAGASLAIGFPVAVDSNLESAQIPTVFESAAGIGDVAAKSLAMRKVKLRSLKPQIPALYSSSYEGETIRRSEASIDFNGDKQPVYELLLMRDLSSIEDHRINIIRSSAESSETPPSLGIIVEVAGREMQRDFEYTVQKRIGTWISRINGVSHSGNSQHAHIRISKTAAENGITLSGIAEAIYTMAKSELGYFIDACQVTIVTDPLKAKEIFDRVLMPITNARAKRFSEMVDESVDNFYTCTICQALSPSQCCVITPERPGLCGEVTWLGCKTRKEIDSDGPCQPVEKGRATDARSGEFLEVDIAVKKASKNLYEDVEIYSIMSNPMPAYFCYDCVCVADDECGGVVIVSKDYLGPTPLGESFFEIAARSSMGVQTPGVLGVCSEYISSKKFIQADGGMARVVWMPRTLKDQLRERLNISAKELYGIDDFTDMIADEQTALDKTTLISYLEQASHPALEMESLFKASSPSTDEETEDIDS